MLRAGVGFASIMQLLGHKDPHMTLEYVGITLPDLQREFHGQRSPQTAGTISHLRPSPLVPHLVPIWTV